MSKKVELVKMLIGLENEDATIEIFILPIATTRE